MLDHFNFMITTACNQKCLHCCCDIPNKNPVHTPVEEVERIARILNPIYEVRVTGGETTLHPDLDAISIGIREWIGCTELSIDTNAHREDWHHLIPSFLRFDRVVVTQYDENTYQGCPYNNHKSIEILRSLLPADKLLVLPAVHVPRSIIGNGNPCHRGNNSTAIYSQGLIWPCCVAPGVRGGVGIQVTSNCREELKLVKTPCDQCWFSL